jgi:hypothetical protein
VDKRDHFFGETVTEATLDQSFDWAEDADQALASDAGMVGIHLGLAVSEQAVPDLTVQITGGAATGPSGERIYVAAPTTTVSCAVDRYGQPTTVGMAGWERWCALYARFTRNATDPAVDDNGVTVYTKQYEAVEFLVEQGVDALIGAATRPALLADAVHLCDFRLVNAQTAVTNGDLDLTRRGDWLRMVLGNLSTTVVYGTPQAACEALWTAIDALAASTGGALVGVADYTTANAHVTWAGATAQDALEATADAIDGHIVGAAPNHPASAISTAVIAGTPESEAAPSTVQAVLTNVFTHLNARTERSESELIAGDWRFGNVSAAWFAGHESNAYLGSCAAGVHAPLTPAANRYGAQAFGDNLLGSWGHPNDAQNMNDFGGAQVVELCMVYDPGYLTDNQPHPYVVALCSNGELHFINAATGFENAAWASTLPAGHTYISMCSNGADLIVIAERASDNMARIFRVRYYAAAVGDKWAEDHAGAEAGWVVNMSTFLFGSSPFYPLSRVRFATVSRLVVLCAGIASNTNGVLRLHRLDTGALDTTWGASGLARGTGSTANMPTGGLCVTTLLADTAKQVIAYSTGGGASSAMIEFARISDGSIPAGVFASAVATLTGGGTSTRSGTVLDISFDGQKLWWAAGSGLCASMDASSGIVAYSTMITQFNQGGLLGTPGYAGACVTDGFSLFVASAATAGGLATVAKRSVHGTQAVWGTGLSAALPSAERLMQSGARAYDSDDYDDPDLCGRMLCDGAHVWAVQTSPADGRDTVARLPLYSMID